MLPYLTSYYGNPHSRTHAYGWESEKAMEKAREQIANLIEADAKEIIFTSGATESNNIAIKGVARLAQRTLVFCTNCFNGKIILDFTALKRNMSSQHKQNINVCWTHVGHWKEKAFASHTYQLKRMEL